MVFNEWVVHCCNLGEFKKSLVKRANSTVRDIDCEDGCKISNASAALHVKYLLDCIFTAQSFLEKYINKKIISFFYWINKLSTLGYIFFFFEELLVPAVTHFAEVYVMRG